MRARSFRLATRAVVAIAGAGILSASIAGQAPSTSTTPNRPSTAPRTPWGHPDLQGTWNAATLTPLERPETVAGKLAMTKEEAEAIAQTERKRVEARAQPSNPDRPVPKVDGNVGGYNNFWIDRGSSAFVVDGQHRTSIIVEPADGKIPPQIPEAQRRNAGARGSVVLPTSDAAEASAPTGRGAYDDIELRPLAERCILAFGSTSGPPSLPNYFYNNNKQIVQTPDSVVILVEMVHDARVIRLNGQHPPAHVKKWMGDSIGRWEGDTLVVETTNFTNKTRFRGSSDNLKVTERFKRLDNGTILYRFTVEDPTTWATPWTGEYPWEPTSDNIYEYACHEGNYAMVGIMKGERLLDKEKEAQGAADKR